MEFPSSDIVREALSYAVLDAVWTGARPTSIPTDAWDFTVSRYGKVFGEKAVALANDVKAWLEARMPIAGGVSQEHRRLMLELWTPETFTGG